MPRTDWPDVTTVLVWELLTPAMLRSVSFRFTACCASSRSRGSTETVIGVSMTLAPRKLPIWVTSELKPRTPLNGDRFQCRFGGLLRLCCGCKHRHDDAAAGRHEMS